MKFLKSGSARALILEGNLDAVKFGTAETYLGAFGIFLGGNPLQIGALATLPALIGSLAQTIGTRFVDRSGSRRRILAGLMKAQGLLWLPIALLPFLLGSGWNAVATLIALAVVYQVLTGVMSPIWNSLAGDIIPQEVRGEFFGYRNKWISITVFISVVVGGQLIHSFTGWGYPEYGFAAAFVIAMLARWWGGHVFGRVDDPPIHVPDDSKFTFWQFISRARHSNFVKFVLFVSFMNFAVAVSGPYFAMYMLSDLKLSYLEYTCVVATAVLIQFVVMRSWGVLSDQFGNRKILRVCGWLVAFNPWMWLVSDHILFLVFIQLYSGFFWSGFNLAAANFVFDAVTPAKRARCIAYQAIVNGVLVSAGSLIGGVLAMNMPDVLTRSLSWLVPASPFLGLFLISGVLRAMTMAFLYPAFREVRAVQRIRGHELLVRVTTLRPLWGATYAFINQRRSHKSD